jgi:type VI secretion system protein ImpE
VTRVTGHQEGLHVSAQQLYQAGRMDDALRSLADTLRADPTDVRSRTFLFELLCFAGEYDRAARHLDVIADSSSEAAMGALVYQSALHAERTRQDMFLAGLVPPPPTAAVAGLLNGQRFSSIADADPRIGPRLEVFAAGQYTLLPFAQLAELRIEEPRLLRDLLWPTGRPRASAAMRDFEFGEVLVPALAPLSWRHEDWQVRLGREVAWEVLADGSETPVGPKLLRVDDELVPILDVRELIIDTPAG